MSSFINIDANYGTYNPCMIIIRNKGYSVRVLCDSSLDGKAECFYYAFNDDVHFVADSGPELLGLVVMWETFGSQWNMQETDIMSEIIVNKRDLDD